MNFDKKAKEMGFIVGIPKQLYTVTISRKSTLYLERIAGYWIAWRENYAADRTECISHKTIVESRNFEYALEKAAEYTEFIRKLQKKEVIGGVKDGKFI